MFSVTVRDHVMIAHSFRGELFGPAQRLHGATYVIDVEFRSPRLSASGVVVDIGRALDALKTVLDPLRYQNLDDDASLQGKNTTTEYLAQIVFERMKTCIDRGDLGEGAESLTAMKVTLNESHVAWAAYEGSLAK
jgi:6-pyruvoyl-tetrahydropterin synthase